MNLLASQSGVFLLTWVLFSAFDFEPCRTVCFCFLCGALRMPKRFHHTDRHERLRPASGPTVSY
jgi:hypothetical protein